MLRLYFHFECSLTRKEVGNSSGKKLINIGYHDAAEIVNKEKARYLRKYSNIGKESHKARQESPLRVPAKLAPHDYPFKTPIDSARGQKLAAAWVYEKQVADSIQDDDPKVLEKRQLVAVADHSFKEADESYIKGRITIGETAFQIGIMALDIAIDLSPQGWMKDTFEALSGRSLLTGETLSTFERGVAFVGVGLVIGAVVIFPEGLAVIGALRALKSIFKKGGAGVQAERATVEGLKVVDSAKPFTERLTPGKIRDYLSKVDTIPRENLITDIESVGLKLKGNDRTRPFLEFVDSEGRVRAKIHPPDKATEYHHLHIYDKDGNPMTSALEVIAGKKGYKSPDAHIEIMEP